VTVRHRDANAIVPDWDSLADRVAASPFLRAGWIQAWARAFAGGRVEAITAEREGAVVGFLPFLRGRRRIASPANYHSPEFGILAVDAEATGAVAREAFALGAGTVVVSFVDASSTGAHALRAAATAGGYAVAERVRLSSPYVDIHGDWQEFERRLSPNLRGDVKRRRRRAEETGTLSVDVEDGSQRLAELLDDGFAVEGSGWKDAEGTAIRSQPNTLRFYREVAEWAAARGWLRLAFLRLDGRTIAFHYDLEADGVLYHLKGGFDTRYERMSPGKVLHYELLARCFAAGSRRYEFLGGAERYKLQFARGTRDLVEIRAFAPGLGGRVEHAVYAYGRPLARRVRDRVRR
jgi:CelD/BcsL family acetyltransferase involved in cellulose biosynthesis